MFLQVQVEYWDWDLLPEDIIEIQHLKKAESHCCDW